MPHHALFRPVRTRVSILHTCVVLLFGFTFSASAQPIKDTSAVNRASAEFERGTFRSAKAAAKAGNIDAAEQALGAIGAGKPGSSSYYRNGATRMLQLADQLNDTEGRVRVPIELCSSPFGPAWWHRGPASGRMLSHSPEGFMSVITAIWRR